MRSVQPVLLLLTLCSLVCALTSYSVAVEDRKGRIAELGELVINQEQQIVESFTLLFRAEDTKIGEGCIGILEQGTFKCHSRIRTSRAQVNALRAVLYKDGSLEQLQIIKGQSKKNLNRVEVSTVQTVPRPLLKGRVSQARTVSKQNEEPSFLRKNWKYLLVPFALTFFIRASIPPVNKQQAEKNA